MSDTDHVLNLRLLAHPFTGHPGLTDAERETIIAAAAELERLAETVKVLGALAHLLSEQIDHE